MKKNPNEFLLEGGDKGKDKFVKLKPQHIENHELQPEDASVGLMISQGHFVMHFVFWVTLHFKLVTYD